MIRRNFRDGLDMVVHRPASDLGLAEGLRVAMALFFFAIVWMILGILAIIAATAVFPTNAEGLAVDALSIIFNAWPLPSIGLGVLSVALCFKAGMGQLRSSGE